MDIDFYQDENGKIWVFYGRNIVVRPKKRSRLEMANERKKSIIFNFKSFNKAEDNENHEEEKPV